MKLDDSLVAVVAIPLAYTVNLTKSTGVNMKTASWLGLVLLMIGNATVLGQKNTEEEGPVGIFPSRAEYNQFLGGAKGAAYGPNGSEELRAMLPMLYDIANNRPVGSAAAKSGATGSNFGLLSNEQVRQELEMVDSQCEELKDLRSRIQQRATEQIRELDLTDRANLVSQIQKIHQQANDDMNSVLLPHQLDRLKQIRMQALLQRRGLVDVLTSEPVKTELEISQQQADELKEFESVVQEDLAKEIAKLQEKARDRLLSKLTPTQEKQAKEMIGDAFVFPAKERQTGKRRTTRGRKGK